MDLIQQIINQARNILACPVCSTHYDANQIRFRGFIDSTYIFQAICNKSHEPVAVTYLASLKKMDQPISAYFHTLSGEKITDELADEAEDMIERFDSDISVLWKS